MSALVLRLAIACVRGWTGLYTSGLSPAFRDTRRAEIESDLWEFQHDAAGEGGLGGALQIFLRLLIGIPDDVGWRVDQAAAGGIAQGSIVMGGRVAGFALVLCAVWVIGADASRIRTPLAAQSPAPAGGGPAFEAASIKPNKSGDGRIFLIPQPGGRLTGSNVTAAMLIRFAYGLPDFQTTGGPGWLDADHFDILAKGEGDPPLEQQRLMLRRMLAERFKLVVHTETRDLPMYALVTARNDGSLGRQLRRTQTDCDRAAQPALGLIGPSPSNGPPPCGYFGMAPGTDVRSGQGGFAFRGLTMAALAKMLVPMVHRSVSDRTGLTGYFDADFDFLAEVGPPPPPPGIPDPFDRASFLSVFTVFPEQLGLKLDARRGPVEVLVIDRVEQPTPD